MSAPITLKDEEKKKKTKQTKFIFRNAVLWANIDFKTARIFIHTLNRISLTKSLAAESQEILELFSNFSFWHKANFSSR